jgi:pimeloyl-ACP methyl ester carboxylesterase
MGKVMVETSRIPTHCFVGGPPDGVPVLLVHGKITTGRFWQGVAEGFPDLRAFGRTERKPVDATRGLRDWSDDLHALVEALGWAGSGRIHLAGWSNGGGVVQQYAIDHGDQLASIALVAPLSPYGFGGSRDVDGTPCWDDWAGTGGGTAAPDFVRRMAEVLLTDVGDTGYPGDTTTSPNWPGVAPGRSGVNNAFSGRWCDTSAFADLPAKPPVLWLRGDQDQVISDESMFDFGTLGKLEVVPGWPGMDVFPPQPQVGQTRAMLDRYAAGGGPVREVVLDGCGHGPPVERAADLRDHLLAHIEGAA